MAMHLKICTHDTSRPGVSISGSDFTQRGCKFGALSWRLYYPSRLARKNSGDGVKSLVLTGSRGARPRTGLDGGQSPWLRTENRGASAEDQGSITHIFLYEKIQL